jgi:hypothetical protein
MVAVEVAGNPRALNMNLPPGQQVTLFGLDTLSVATKSTATGPARISFKEIETREPDW